MPVGSPVFPPGDGSPIRQVFGPFSPGFSPITGGFNYGPSVDNSQAMIKDPTQGTLPGPAGNHNPNANVTSAFVLFSAPSTQTFGYPSF